MTFGSIFLGIALLLVVGLFVARPFLLPTKRQAENALSRREALEAQKEAVLTQIRELDFDHETGKIPEEEYDSLRRQYLAEATSLLKALDALRPEGDRVTATDDIEAAIARLRQQPAAAEDEIEAAVARRRKQSASANGRTPAAQTSTATAAGTPKAVQAKRAGFCPQCGEARGPDDRFCAYCGHAFT